MISQNNADGLASGSPSNGLLLIQIDGLSRFQLERALRSGKMPFLKGLLERSVYQLKSFYPGLPSCTPAVQAELHYGKPCATPAFSFFDRDTQSEVRMYDSEWAQRISAESQKSGEGLLRGGSSYANIYSGGAEKAKYCGEVNTFDHWSSELSPIRLFKRAIRYPRSAYRVFKLICAEIGIGFLDAVKGILKRGELFQELKFLPARVGVAVALREAICGEVTDDLDEGLPIIHANFFGYDEAAHRRGPQSRFAHWSLRGIDHAIKRLHKAATKTESRRYKVIIFSDHGQEHTIPYSELTGMGLKENLANTLNSIGEYKFGNENPIDAAMERATAYVRNLENSSSHSDSVKNRVHLQAMGPVAHFTSESRLEEREKQRIAKAFCQQCSIPYVCYLDTEGQVVCTTSNKRGSLDILGNELVNRNHQFVDETIEDLATLVRSKYAGDLVLLGWRSEQKPITFADERGAHAGPGAEECHGFVILPDAISYSSDSLRPIDLRNLALHAIGRRTSDFNTSTRAGNFRILSYNVHGGVGVDRKRSQDRLAAVIRESGADLICFQEAFESLDGVRHSLRDSVCVAWRSNAFHYEFLTLHQSKEYRYGLAIASKRPFVLKKSSGFNLDHPKTIAREPRGAIWIELEDPLTNRSIHVVNTHFGLQSLERRLQAKTLIGNQWLNGIEAKDQIVICGDLNTGPKGPAYQTIADRYADTQLVAENGRPSPSFLSWAPLRRIDHIFTSPNLRVSKAGVHKSPLSRWASDHLPIFADIKS